MASGMAYLYCGQGALFIVSEFQKQITSTRVFRQERHRTMQRSSMLVLSTFAYCKLFFVDMRLQGDELRPTVECRLYGIHLKRLARWRCQVFSYSSPTVRMNSWRFHEYHWQQRTKSGVKQVRCPSLNLFV